ncbi:MAG: hypothetical protein HKN46_00545 [Acidimicrobiia bacterium]|nr:hypothetical protein [Acidimicrobiia bacterium]
MARYLRIVLVGCVGALVLASCTGDPAPTEEVDPPSAVSSTTTTTERPPTTTTSLPPTTTATTTEPMTTTTTNAVVVLEPEAAFLDATARATEIGWLELDGLIPDPDFTLACAAGSDPVQVLPTDFWGGWSPPGARFEQVRVSAYATEAEAEEAFAQRRGWFESCTADQAVGYARTPIEIDAEGLLAWHTDVLQGDEVLGSASWALAIEGVTVWVVSAADEATLLDALTGLRLTP